MEKQELYKELASRILKIFDKFGNEIPFNTVEFRYYKSKYSSTGKDAMTIFIDGIPTPNMDNKKYTTKTAALRAVEANFDTLRIGEIGDVVKYID